MLVPATRIQLEWTASILQSCALEHLQTLVKLHGALVELYGVMKEEAGSCMLVWLNGELADSGMLVHLSEELEQEAY